MDRLDRERCNNRDLARLLESCAVGNREAFAALYDATAAILFRLGLLVLRDRKRAEQCTQNTYARIWLTASSFDASTGSALSWLATITYRNAQEALRA
ncbi:sigma factor [Terrabacter carboxydivorans]|uniref:RNA polymerase sigma-70 region 2 domain-containing protein n=1 Tax=Terrabacter carboxydivorans TaxID=619730 RepID=A0ABP5ZWP8_9MICO